MKKTIRIILLAIVILCGLSIKCYAGSFSVSTSTKTAEPGSTISINITGNNATGRINLSGSNISLSSSAVWVENGTQTITGTITGGDGQTASITATAAGENLVDSTTADEIKGSKSASVAIKKKEVVVEQKTPQVVENSKPTTSTSTKNNTKKTTVAKQQNTQTNEYKEDQGTVAEFGITSLYIFGVNDSEEKSEIAFSPNFDINVSDYSCTVGNNIKRLEFDYDANEYRDLVHIDGIDKELEAGENVVTITMQNTDGNTKTYKIVVTKEAPVEAPKEEADMQNGESNNAENSNADEGKKKYVTMPLGGFIAMIVSIVIGEAGAIIGGSLVIKRAKYNERG